MMIDLPENTRVHKRLPKEAFYQHLNLSNESAVKEIMLLVVTLKKKEFDGKVIEAIARQNKHELVFLLLYPSEGTEEREAQLAVYRGRLYRSPWMLETNISLAAQGFSLEEIMAGFIEQIALTEDTAKNAENISIDERLHLQEQIEKLTKLIEKTERAVWKEVQPKKRFDLYQKLVALFPNAVTETVNEDGEVVRAIDADVLRQEISATVVEGKKERYQFTWPDKKKSVVLANQPIAKTLRLNREKSVGRDGTPGKIDTENIYIEGDNLDALKLLQETYLGKVKMIYIDPPYNTGSDAFVYDDDFSESAEEFAENSGAVDEEGNRLFDMRVNNESNGRFHTDWLNMMYPRLRLAKDLLADDGVIFISMDDNEQENLKKICDEIFGAGNFIAQLVWERAFSPKNDAKYISNSHDYVHFYGRIVKLSATLSQNGPHMVFGS